MCAGRLLPAPGAFVRVFVTSGDVHFFDDDDDFASSLSISCSFCFQVIDEIKQKKGIKLDLEMEAEDWKQVSGTVVPPVTPQWSVCLLACRGPIELCWLSILGRRDIIFGATCGSTACVPRVIMGLCCSTTRGDVTIALDEAYLPSQRDRQQLRHY